MLESNLTEAILTGEYRWTNNLSWSDSVKFQMATYFASPRMWPLGYILGSPYSPLYLEQQFPDLNWRDRFEDLLALESGTMISARSRQNEAVTAARIRNESVHNDISHINQEVRIFGVHISSYEPRFESRDIFWEH